MKNRSGFTFIEILLTLAILAIAFVPVMQLFSGAIGATAISGDTITATHLGRWQMERIKNLDYSKIRLSENGDSLYPPIEKDAFEINGTKWRIRTEVVPKTDPVELRVSVFKDGHLEKPVSTLVTLIEDTTWEEVRPM